MGKTITITLDVQDARIHRDALSHYLADLKKTPPTKNEIRNAALEHLRNGVEGNIDAIKKAIFAPTASSTVPYAEDVRRAEEAASRAFGPRLRDGEEPLGDEPTAHEQGREDF